MNSPTKKLFYDLLKSDIGLSLKLLGFCDGEWKDPETCVGKILSLKLGRVQDRERFKALNIAFDPRVSIGAVALILDAKLGELDQTIFSDPAVRLPDDVYPFIQDPQISRAYFRLSLARFFKAFPETAINFPDYFPYSLHSWNIEFLGSYIKLMEAALEQPDSLPDLETYFLPSYQHRSAMVDFMGDLNDPNVSDCLSIMLTPTP